MHIRPLSLVLASAAIAAPAAFADPLTLPSRVDAVTVFPQGVSIHRIGHATLAAGEHQVVFAALPPTLSDDTVRIGGFGPGATAQSVSVRTGRLAEVTGPGIARIADDVSGLERERIAAVSRSAELARLAGASPTERVRLAPQIDDAQRRVASLTARLAERTQSLATARSEGERPVKFVMVDIDTAHDGDLDLGIEYMVPNAAGWRPTYAARLDADGGRVGLDLYASVQQSTGEDWANVHLSVSSVVPSAGLALPTFEENTIELEPGQTPSLERAARSVADQSEGLDLGPLAAPASVARMAPRPAPAPQTPIEQPQGHAHAHLLAARLEIPSTVTIRSGAPARRVLAAHADLASTLEYQAAPRQSSSVFLAARFRNSNTFPLLEGPAALFIGSDYVGTAAMRETPIDEDVLLPFGADAGVTIDRTLAERHLAVRNGRDESTLRYSYRLTNHRNRAVDVTVFDQLPVSRSQGLSVRTLAGTRALDARREGDAAGVIRWRLRSTANETDRWTLAYVVSAPHGRAIDGAVE